MGPHSPFERSDTLVLGRFPRPRARSTTLAVVADAHVSPTAAGTWKQYHRTESRLERVVADANARGVDAVVLAGDLTRDGHPAEFDRVAAILDGLAVPVVAVPGNHDVPKAYDDHDVPPLLSFVDRFAPGALPFRERVGDVDLIGINTASRPDGSLAGTHGGGVSEAQLAWLDRTLRGADTPVVVGHHTVARGRDHAHDGMATDEYRLDGARRLAGAFETGGVALSLSGHVHWPTVAPLPGGGHEVVAPALCSYPAAYLLVHVAPDGTTVELAPAATPSGVAEAYDAAREHDRGARLVDAADAGYFERFPLVDARHPVQ
jgi:3',5'-cyclic AMP phosphodiesterase CpdA